MATTLMGTPVTRVDGRKKVTGTAQYAAEVPAAHVSHAILVGSPHAGGSIRRIDTSAADNALGVLLVLTHENRGALGKLPNSLMAGGTTAEDRPPFEEVASAQRPICRYGGGGDAGAGQTCGIAHQIRIFARPVSR